jgi:cytidylate kinase
MGDVIVVTGPPGAGKSTVAAHLVDLLDPSALVAGDDFFAFLRNGAISPWLPAARDQNTVVIEAAAAATGRLTGWADVVYDGILGPWFLDTFLGAAGLESLHYAILLPPLEECLDRVQTRTGHGFTDPDAARHMWDEFAQADIDSRHVIVGHGTDPEDTARDLKTRVRDQTLRFH